MHAPRLSLPSVALVIAAVCGLQACGPAPDEALASAQTYLDAGDYDGAQSAFRRGLERHPDDVPLLLTAANFYLRADAEDHYKPRLGLHYASRASRADDADRVEVTSALVRALRAMDQHGEASETLAGALSRRPGDPTLQALQGTAEAPQPPLALPRALD